MADENEFLRLESHHLTADFRADRAPRAGDENGFIFELVCDGFHVELDFFASEQVFDLHVADVIHRHFAGHKVFDARDRLRAGAGVDTQLRELCHLRFGHRRDGDDDVFNLEVLDEPRDVFQTAGYVDGVNIEVLLRPVVIDKDDRLQAVLRILSHLADDHRAGLSGADDHRGFRVRVASLGFGVAVHPPGEARAADQEDVQHPRDRECAEVDVLDEDHLDDGDREDRERDDFDDRLQLRDGCVRPCLPIEAVHPGEEVVGGEDRDRACEQHFQLEDVHVRMKDKITGVDREKDDTGVDEDKQCEPLAVIHLFIPFLFVSETISLVQAIG